MVRDADGDLFGLQPLIHFRQVFEAPHSPGHVVQAHLLLLRSQGVFTHLEEGDVVRVARVAREEGCAQLGRSRKGHGRSEEHTSELQSPCNLVCRLLLEKKKNTKSNKKESL